jgi:hypothetical protein
VVEGLSAQLGLIDGAVGSEGVGIGCELHSVAVGVPGVFFFEGQVVQVCDEEDGFVEGEGGDAVDDVCG